MEIKVDGRLLVSTLCERFKEEFGGTLRVYQGNKRLTGSEKVADIAKETGSYECKGMKTVGGFEKEMMERFGLKVQVASVDDWVLALDEMTLSKLKDIPKQATKADMENLKANYGVSKEKEVTIPRKHLCAPRRADGTYYIDEIFTWDKQDIYKDVTVLIFPKKGDVAFEKCDEIRGEIMRDDLPSIKEIRIPKEWKDALVVPKGVKKTYY